MSRAHPPHETRAFSAIPGSGWPLSLIYSVAGIYIPGVPRRRRSPAKGSSNRALRPRGRPWGQPTRERSGSLLELGSALGGPARLPRTPIPCAVEKTARAPTHRLRNCGNSLDTTSSSSKVAIPPLGFRFLFYYKVGVLTIYSKVPRKRGNDGARRLISVGAGARCQTIRFH